MAGPKLKLDRTLESTLAIQQSLLLSFIMENQKSSTNNNKKEVWEQGISSYSWELSKAAGVENLGPDCSYLLVCGFWQVTLDLIYAGWLGVRGSVSYK